MLHSLTTIRAATVADADALAGLADAPHTRRLHGRALIAEGDCSIAGLATYNLLKIQVLSIRNLPERRQEDRIPSPH
jgi:hypothetical protein